MNDIEKLLNENSQEINNLKTPDEMESRLYNALKENRKAPKLHSWKLKVAVFLLSFVLVGYNANTLAYYAKNIVGYDNVMNLTLQNLNEQGRGQVIDKSYTFENGVKVTLDGIMLDDNQLLVFYTLTDTDKQMEILELDTFDSMDGLIGSHRIKGGHGEYNDEWTQIVWNVEFERPYFFERKIDWNFSITEDNVRENGQISFVIDRNKAMGSSLKKSINEKVKVEDREINIKSILASPTRTTVKGSLQNTFELAKDYFNGETWKRETIEIQVLADGEELQKQGGNMSTDHKGVTFSYDYDALPSDTQKLELEITKFSADYAVDYKIPIDENIKDKVLNIHKQEIVIKEVSPKGNETYITFTSEESTSLTRVFLLIDGNITELDSTATNDYEKHKDGRYTHTRTMKFKGSGKDMSLLIEGIKHNLDYNKVIDIDIN